jgi:hypothetical protein
VQFGSQPVPLFGKATMMNTMVKPGEPQQITDFVFKQTELSKPFAAPPGTPKDRVTALRKALMDSMKDRAMIAEAGKMNIELTAISGEEVAAAFNDFGKTPPALVKKAGEYVQLD